jgi:hypothetical protein
MLSKKIHYPVTLEVHQDGAGMRCAQTKVLYTKHTHLLSLATKSLSDALQESVRAEEQSQLVSQPRSRLATKGESDPLQRLPLALCGAGVDAGNLIPKRSAKILRRQEGWSQKNLRTRTLRRTGVPHHGRSAKVRV